MPPPTAPPKCPSCGTPLALFTPRESIAHVNACLDARLSSSSPRDPPPICAICSRDLSALTPHARIEHANRCADSTLPLPPTTRRTRQTSRAAPSRAPPVRPQPPPPDPRVQRLLTMLGLERYVSRFAAEEIDLVALRLLNPNDFLHLRIPEAARRRIAEAMQSVHVLAHVEGDRPAPEPVPHGPAQEDPHEGDPVLTQKFKSSKLGTHAGLESDSDLEDQFDFSMDRRAPACQTEAGADNENHELQMSEANAGAVGAKPVKTLDISGDSESDGIELGVIVGGSSPVDANLASGQRLEAEEEIINEDGARVEIASHHQDEDESELSSLSDLERQAWRTSQITLELKLERWRRKQLSKERSKHRKEVSNERRRHKRELERIQQRYDGMCKRLCGLPSEAPERRPISRVSEEADSMSSQHPSSQSFADNGAVEVAPQVEPAVKKTSQVEKNSSQGSLRLGRAPLANGITPSTKDDDAISVERRREPCNPPNFGLDRSVTIDLTEDASENEENQTKTPVGSRKLFPDPEVTETIVLSSTKPQEKAPRASGSSAQGSLDDRLWNILRAACSDNSSQQSEAETRRAARAKQKSLFSSSDEEEVMDLTCADAGNAEVGASAALKLSAAAASKPTELEDERDSANPSAPTEKEADTNAPPNQSRLKKKRKKVTPADVIAAIRRDKSLYDDILMMESVPFARILNSVTSSGVKVAKKNLTTLLQKEGVSFKLDEPTEKKKAAAASYFSRLNEHSD
eukprot:GFKZ01000825.1.p1 GENE.GFKZ01000825.1~~GFKZ01000825.1.p1  ORF type:complete len:758 (+),score=110.04 GFKZ01000825.1:36-2276(+)